MKPYSKSTQHEVKEIEIPVPWGKVAGKLWGSQNKQPILALHGWQDNAASFDNIAPLIMKNIPVLAIDLPGHGLSSWLPPGFMYSELIYFLLIKRIKRYTSIHTPIFRNAVDAFFKLEEDYVQPSYTQNEIMKKISTGLYMLNLDESSTKILMTRGVTQKEDGMYVVNRDPRMRVIPIHNMVSSEQVEEPDSHLDGKAESGKAKANQNSRKDRTDKRNVPPTTTAGSDWPPLFRFPLFH
ncbi:PREDICTED: probable serine hydrolase [Atta cephalotes]|uniref:AB hydrolase-1 domain-containing protein n=1 Tax=Atta cephalotes TaxID=12957 RepID=A0A158NZE4_ATTCE|nr:PREDICTED: probable serine hydrolase [Atta cephalotes]